MATTKVGSSVEFRAALKTAKGGDVIELAPGDYSGDILIFDQNFDRPITIRSVDPQASTVLEGRMWIKNSSGITFENLDFKLADDAEDTWLAQIEVRDGKDLTFNSIEVAGRVARKGEGRNPDVEKGPGESNDLLEGYPLGLGVSIRGSSNIVFDELDLSMTAIGMRLWTSENVSITNSVIHDIRRDGIKLSGIKDVTIEDSIFHSFRPYFSNVSNTGDHGDFIQYFNGPGDRGIDGLTLAGNAFLLGSGHKTQGFFGRYYPEKGTEDEVDRYQNISIHDNLFHTAHPNALIVGSFEGAEVYNNTLIPASENLAILPLQVAIPRLLVSSGNESKNTDGVVRIAVSDVSIHHNVIVAKSGSDGIVVKGLEESQYAKQGLRIEDNAILSMNPSHSNYWGHFYPDLIDNPLTDLASVIGLEIGGVREMAPWIFDAVAEINGPLPTDRVGGDGDDVLAAAAEGSRFFAGPGNDELIGGAGFDVLVDGLGSDTMTGGGRGDVFSLTVNTSGAVDRDVITDLNFVEGDEILFRQGAPSGFFNNKLDLDNAIQIKHGAARIDSDADIAELLLSPYIKLGNSQPGDVELHFDFDKNGTVDYKLVLEGYAREFLDGDAVIDAGDELEEEQPDPDEFDPDAEEGGSGGDPDDDDDDHTEIDDDDGAVLVGGPGSQILVGGPGADQISGGAGDDTLIGLGGDDVLFGGSGADRFFIAPTSPVERDRIEDLDFAAGDALALDLPAAHPLLSAAFDVAHVELVASGGLLVKSEIGLIDVMRLGGIEVSFAGDDATLSFPTGAGAYSLELAGFAATLQEAIRPDATVSVRPNELLAVEAPRFDDDEVILVEGFPPGYFAGLGLARPAGQTDDSAVLISSYDDLRQMIEGSPLIGAVARGSETVEIRFSLGLDPQDGPLAAVTIRSLEGVSSYELVHGPRGDATFIGNQRGNYFDGSGADAVILAMGGDDIIHAGSGRDWIDGGEGGDRIVGGKGDDTMIGGAGADNFFIHGNARVHGEKDVIADLSFSEGDRLVLSKFGKGTFDPIDTLGTRMEIGGVDDLLALHATPGFALERIANDGLVLTIETASGISEGEIMLEAAALAQFDSAGLG